jgi:hypothetical protein
MFKIVALGRVYTPREFVGFIKMVDSCMPSGWKHPNLENYCHFLTSFADSVANAEDVLTDITRQYGATLFKA